MAANPEEWTKERIAGNPEEWRKELLFWPHQKIGGQPGIMEKEASILAAPKRWEYILGPTVNKGMLQMTAVGSPVAITKLMMDSLKKKRMHVIRGMRNLNMDRERQERGCDEVNYT